MSFKEQLTNLSETNKKLLSYYGDWSDEPQYRASLACTGLDEYIAIRQSLYIMLNLMQNDSADELMKIFSHQYSEDGFCFEGINPVSDKEKTDYINNLQTLLKTKNELKNKWQDNFEEKLISLFLYHDLGKQIAFVLDNNLSGSCQPVAAGNESYLKTYFKKHAALGKDFELASKWIDVMDGLGYNPKKLLSGGYVGLLTSVDKTLDFLNQLNKSSNDLLGNSIEAFNSYLFNKAKELGLNTEAFEFLKLDHSKRLPWHALTLEQQKQVVMIVLACPFIFVKPPLNKDVVSKEFIQQWKDNANAEIVNQMTAFMVHNVSADNPILLYNITGAIHHTSAQGGSHFANGGSVNELFTVFFPWVLRSVNGGLQAEPGTVCSFNKYQLLQGIEVCFAMMQNLLDGSSLKIDTINFASPENKSDYLNALAMASVNQDPSFANLTKLMAKTGSPVFGKKVQSANKNDDNLLPPPKPYQ